MLFSFASIVNPEVLNFGEMLFPLYDKLSPTFSGISPNICLYQTTLSALGMTPNGQLRVRRSPDFTERSEKFTDRTGARKEIKRDINEI